MCFIPVQLGEPEPAVPQPDSSDAFHLPPAALTIEALIAPLDEVSIHDLSHLEVYRTKWLPSASSSLNPPATPSRPEKLHEVVITNLSARTPCTPGQTGG